MPLPILHVVHAPDAATLVRYFHQTESNWTAHLAEPEVLACGTAYASAELGNVHQANRVLDAALPAGMGAAEAFELVANYFAERKSRCRQWVMNPSATPAQTAPLVEYLLSHGHAARAESILSMDRISAHGIKPVSLPLQIIPARASFKHARMLLEQCAADDREPQLTDAGLMHLDDPHYDALLALHEGKAVAMAGVLSAGEIARIAQVFVSPAHRRRGVGSTMLSRALEICARSLHKHIFLSVRPDQSPAAALYRQFGFRELGTFTAYQV
jgi:ribosomal protein S18 acetylase RimI-like enzyme